MGLSRHDYYTISPQEFYYACKGFFDKEDRRSEIVRLQTFYILASNGAKISKPKKLWSLNSDPVEERVEFEVGSPEHKEWYAKMKERFKPR